MAKTRDEFMDIIDNADGYYVYFLDKNERMHFVADDEYTDGFCDSNVDAFLCTEDEANAIKFLCKLLFPEHTFHVVKIYSSVEWL